MLQSESTIFAHLVFVLWTIIISFIIWIFLAKSPSPLQRTKSFRFGIIMIITGLLFLIFTDVSEGIATILTGASVIALRDGIRKNED